MLTRRLGVALACAAAAAFAVAFLAGRSSRPHAPPAAAGRPVVTLQAPGARPAIARLRRAPALPKLRLPAPVAAPAGGGAAATTGTQESPVTSRQPSTGGQPVTPPSSDIPSGSGTSPQPDPQPPRQEPREEPPVIDEDSG